MLRRTTGALIVCLACVAPASAQQPVEPWADRTSYVTAAVNPTVTVIKALLSPHRKCALGRLAVSEVIGNVAVLALKHFITSPRPCIGCDPDGQPSGHTMNSAIGFLSTGKVTGLSVTVWTGGLRMAAHRHTGAQVTAGGAIGIGSELVAHKLLRCE